jgi:TfoX/Sxy family transcriptional regulator of competence genes
VSAADRGTPKGTSEQLLHRFDELADLVPEANRRQMFGYPSCVIDGHMFLGIYRDNLVLRLSAEDMHEMIDRFGAQPFEPMPGRPMTGFVAVPRDMWSTDDLDPWIVRSFAHARSMPPKTARRPKGHT